MKKPTEIKILGITYKVDYTDKPSEVDLYKRSSLWGQIDYWTRTIRIYDGSDRSIQDLWQTIIHEILHGIAEELHCEEFKKESNHKELDLIATGLMNVFFDNDFIKIS